MLEGLGITTGFLGAAAFAPTMNFFDSSKCNHEDAKTALFSHLDQPSTARPRQSKED
jgi:hypothetical protein